MGGSLGKLKADVSSVSPPSERMEELWVDLVYMENGGAKLLIGTWRHKKQKAVKKSVVKI